MKPADYQKASRKLRKMIDRLEAAAAAETPRQRATRTLAVNRIAQEARRLFERNAEAA